MIANMRQPVDEFAKKLRSLRKARKRSAHDISLKIGRKKGYVAEWERSTLGVNRESLQRVIEELAVSDADARELFRLAALRETPDAAKRYAPGAEPDPDANALAALLSVHHDWPSAPADPTTQHKPARWFAEAASWVIANACILTQSVLCPFSGIRWPDPVYRLGLMPALDGDGIPVPDSLARRELGFAFDTDADLRPETYSAIAKGMAEVYRRLLFSDPDRAAQAVGLLRNWAYGAMPLNPDSMVLRFKQSDHAICDVENVDVQIVLWASAKYTRRLMFPQDVSELAAFSGGTDAYWPSVLTTLAAADPDQIFDYSHGQRIRNVLHAVTWGWSALDMDSIVVAHSLGRKPQKSLAKKLANASISDDDRILLAARWWELAAIEQDILKRYAKSIAALVPAPDEAMARILGTATPARNVATANRDKKRRNPNRGKTT